MNIPDGPEALTSEWLTQALRQTGTITGANVSSFTTQAAGEEGEGLTSRIVRVGLAYDRDDPAAPSSLIAKFHAPDLRTRANANSLGMYESELRFYQQVAGRTELPTPRCYYGDFHESGMTVLLLEDLAPACSVGCNIGASQVELAVREIAGFHAFWWEHPQLDRIMGGGDPDARRKSRETFQYRLQERWEPFLGLTGDILPGPMAEIGKRIVDNWSALSIQLRSQRPRTLIHADYHYDNLMFATSRGGAPFSIIDWQHARPGRGSYDAGMLIGGLPTEQRRSSEMGLLKTYYKILTGRGVGGYSFDQCLRDYKLTMLDGFARLVFIIREPYQDEKPDGYREFDHKFRKIWLPRRCAAILDLGADKLIPELTTR